MTRGLWLLLAIVVPGGSILLGLRWWLTRRQAQWDAADSGRITPPNFRPGMERHDESLRISADRRRESAHAKRREAAQIDAGSSTEDQRRRLAFGRR